MPKSHDPVKPTTTTLKQLLPRFLDQIQSNYSQKPQDIIESWNEVVDKEFLPYTQAVRFEENVLHVKVKNSTVLSLLNGTTYKQKILQKFRKKFPNTEIRSIVFRIG